ncbi:DNA polymerase epsilon subunit 3-like [Xenia sp. Carnegie-2017]|uniref:DNA polymerase epsilon subunit 3-like n=1 Tax=Xenia sp. Carnegie-2017 TaxID=2897299 RepID=UPI001F03E5F5|nr:DNA polymerase epsilon subunit 3-like [Xenia sp. Carnegie-2017]
MAEKAEDLNLPNAVISRLVKEALGDGVNISKEARTAISKAASVFVLYCTSCANNHAKESNRKTLTGHDVIEALDEMEFSQFIEPLKESLEAFKKDQKEKKEAAAKKRKTETSSEDLVTPDTKKQKTEAIQEDNNDKEDKNNDET